MSDEKWRPVLGYEGLYIVSDHGHVRSLPRKGTKGRVLTWRFHEGRYPYVHLSAGGTDRHRAVHKVVAEAFLGPCPVGQEVLHRNGDCSDPKLGNLSYGTHGTNTRDQVRHGRHNQARKTECPHGHGAYDGRHPRGDRYCRACLRAAEARYRARLPLWRTS